MVQPFPHGYPDWGRFVSRADKIFMDSIPFAFGAPHTEVLGYVGDQVALSLRMVSTVGNIKITVQFFNDDTYTNPMSEQCVSMLVNEPASITIPVAGAFAHVLFESSVYPAAMSAQVGTSPTAGVHDMPNSIDNQIISGIGIAVGAGAVSTLNGLRIWPGLATWSVQASPATWSCYLVSVDFLGVQRYIDAITQIATERDRVVMLPPAHIRTVFTNTSGVAGAYDIGVNGRPVLPGL